jgi:hypothetical protein
MTRVTVSEENGTPIDKTPRVSTHAVAVAGPRQDDIGAQ